jgi:alkylation response protein AidB-like acyl-CoA dehydrogenase
VRRRLYGPDHEAYRETVREFLTREVVPYQHDWDRQHMIDRTVFARAAKAGIYGLQIDERFGGAGEHDYRYRMVVCEELARVSRSPSRWPSVCRTTWCRIICSTIGRDIAR